MEDKKMKQEIDERKLKNNPAQLRSYTDLVWHYQEMGNDAQYRALLPRFIGQTREEWVADKMEDFIEAHPNFLEGDEDGDENGLWKGYKRSNLEDQMSQESCGFHFAQDGDYAGAWYVMMTRESRQYLGPEEGGTYGGCSEFIKWTAFNTRDEAEAFVEWYKINKKADHTNKMEWQQSLDLLGGDDTVSSTYPEGYIPSGFKFDSSMEVYLTALPYVPEPEPYYYE